MRAAGWLKDAPFDLTLIVGVTGLACAMGGAVWIEPALFLPLLLFHTWAFGFDHVIATLTKLAGTPGDRRRHRFLLFGLPPLLLVATLGVGQAAGLGALNTIYFVYQWFHTTRQSWGLMQHYRRAAGGLADEPRWLAELTAWALPTLGLLARGHESPAKFLWIDLHLPRVPGVVVAVAGAGAAALLGRWAWSRARAWQRGELPPAHTLYVASHHLVFALAYLVIPDLLAGWLVVNVWHNVQYLAYVWMHNRARFAGGVQVEARVLSWLCQPGARRGAAYFAACLAVSSTLFGAVYAVGDRIDDWLDGRLISVSLTIAFAVNFHHYIVDGLIWKRRHGA